MNEGFIKLFRSLIDWEWYDDVNTCRLFIHLLLKTNYIDKKWRGIEIKKGEILTGREILSKETGLSVMQIRSCLKKLKSTNEITIKTTSKYSIIKLNNYERFNGNNQQINQQVTNEQPTNNQQVTTTKKEKNIKNILVTNIESKISKEISTQKNKTKFQDLLNKYFHKEFIEKIKIKYGVSSEDLKIETELFIIHWTEKNEGGKKEKWEMQKTFDIQKRFYKWFALKNKWNKQKNNTHNTGVVLVDDNF